MIGRHTYLTANRIARNHALLDAAEAQAHDRCQWRVSVSGQMPVSPEVELSGELECVPPRDT